MCANVVEFIFVAVTEKNNILHKLGFNIFQAFNYYKTFLFYCVGVLHFAVYCNVLYNVY